MKFTFTAFHGVGYFYTPVLLENFGFKKESVVFVEEQIMPDADFPTVHFPNPEEGASVLVLKDIYIFVVDQFLKITVYSNYLLKLLIKITVR